LTAGKVSTTASCFTILCTFKPENGRKKPLEKSLSAAASNQNMLLIFAEYFDFISIYGFIYRKWTGLNLPKLRLAPKGRKLA
jgi:hypothetical protein